MLNSSRGLTHMANLAPMVSDTLAELLTKPYVDKRQIIECCLSGYSVRYLSRCCMMQSG